MGLLKGACLSKAVRAIAIIDITTVTIPLTYETLNTAYFLGILDPFGNQKDCLNVNGSSTLKHTSNETGDCSWAYSELHELLDRDERKHSFRLHTYTIWALVWFIIIGGIIEGHLFAILRRGVREEIHYWCKRWVWRRTILLILVVLGSIWKLSRNHYSLWVDGLCDITKIYRFCTLIIVLCYMRELERTVGVVYQRTLPKPKKGSLAQELHLLT